MCSPGLIICRQHLLLLRYSRDKSYCHFRGSHLLTGSMSLLMFSEPPVVETSYYYILLYSFCNSSLCMAFIPIVAALGSQCTLFLSLRFLNSSFVEDGVYVSVFIHLCMIFSREKNENCCLVLPCSHEHSVESFQQLPFPACCTPGAMYKVL